MSSKVKNYKLYASAYKLFEYSTSLSPNEKTESFFNLVEYVTTDKSNMKLSKTIPIEDYIAELGEELGTTAFNFNKSRMKKLYRWVSEEGAHLDHIWPLVSTPNEGFHHINNLILFII